MTPPAGKAILLSCSLLALAGCSIPPLVGLAPEGDRGERTGGSVASIEMITSPAGAMIIAGYGFREATPVTLPLDVDENGRLVRSTKVSVDFSPTLIKGENRNASASVDLAAGQIPPARIEFKRIGDDIKTKVTDRPPGG